MTQAIAMKQMLARNGHEVVATLAGGNPERPLPAFFTEVFDVQRITSPTFAMKGTRGISLRKSILETSTKEALIGKHDRVANQRVLRPDA